MMIFSLLALVLSAHSLADDAVRKPSGSLVFQNQTMDDIAVSIEEACLPTVKPTNIHRLRAHGQVSVVHDVRVASCVLLVPEEKELGVQTSVFVIEPLKDGNVLGAKDRCQVKVHSADVARRTYRLTSNCIDIKG